MTSSPRSPRSPRNLRDPRRLRVEANGRLGVLLVWCVLLAVFTVGAWVWEGTSVADFITVARYGLPALLLCALVGVLVAAQAAAHPLRDDLASRADAALWPAFGVVALTWVALGLTARPLATDAIGLTVQLLFVQGMALSSLGAVRRAARVAARAPVSPPAARRTAA